MSTYKLKSSLNSNIEDYFNRLKIDPIISPNNIKPSNDALKVIGALNPSFLEVSDTKYLFIRVDESPSKYLGQETGSASSANNHILAYVDIYNFQIQFASIESTDIKSPLRKPIIPEGIRKRIKSEQSIDLLLSYISHIRTAKLENGRWKVSNTPFIFPSSELDQYGCEDPRISLVDGKIYLLYSAIGKYGVTTWIAKLSENLDIEYKMMLLGPDHKHAALFPDKINNKYHLLIRPLSRIYIDSIGIWLFESDNLHYWGKPHPLLFPRAKMWDSQRVGTAASPIKTNEGWLLFYYGVDDEDTYRIGAALLDIKDPRVVIGRLDDPILIPKLDWERNGRRADTIFSCGVELYENNTKIRIYYAGADTSIGIADTDLNKIMNNF